MVVSCAVFGQKLKEGKVTYDITYPENNFDDNVKAVLPKEMVLSFSNNKVRMDLQMGMGMNNFIIADNETNQLVMLMDMMGNKISVKLSDKELKKKSGTAEDFVVSKTKETKEIAGYKCQKADVKGKDGGIFTIWFTDDIEVKNPIWTNDFKNIDGFLLEFRMEQNGLTMNMKAKSISPEKISADLFIIPAGYKEITSEELTKMSVGK